jgi:hypothetical protein
VKDSRRPAGFAGTRPAGPAGTAPAGRSAWRTPDPPAAPSVLFYIAECQDCTPVLPQPFYDPGKREEWAKAHRDATGHEVTYREETR